jgi:hypothetical protein
LQLFAWGAAAACLLGTGHVHTAALGALLVTGAIGFAGIAGAAFSVNYQA